MAEPTEGSRLLEEIAAKLGEPVGPEVLGELENLERDRRAEADVESLVNGAEAARADQAIDPITPVDQGADERVGSERFLGAPRHDRDILRKESATRRVNSGALLGHVSLIASRGRLFAVAVDGRGGAEHDQSMTFERLAFPLAALLLTAACASSDEAPIRVANCTPGTQYPNACRCPPTEGRRRARNRASISCARSASSEQGKKRRRSGA